MIPIMMRLMFAAALLGAAATLEAAEQPVTFQNLVPPEPNRADEPPAEKFSLDRALHFLDSASLDWQQSWQCFTCHTNISYLRRTVRENNHATDYLVDGG